MAEDVTLFEHLHKLVVLKSEEEIENLLQLLWLTRKTGLSASPKSSVQSLLNLLAPGDLHPLQAAFLVQDDIEDNSHMRRGKKCWFRVPKVGKIAINDGVLLIIHVFKILKKHFEEMPYYVDLLDLFNEVVFQTVSGQMLDLNSITQGKRDLSNYTLDLNRRIAQYKTSYSSIYLPAACALLISGENLENHVNVKDVLLDMGIYYQIILNDYLDCFGDPKKTGKIGSDIEDLKCSWLIGKAFELCNEEQKKILHEHYGKASPDDVAKVKGVYNDINLQGAFIAYESETFDKITNCVEAHPCKAVKAIWHNMQGRQWI